MIARALAAALLLPAAAPAQDLARQISTAAGAQPAWVEYRVELERRSAEASRSSPASRSLTVCCGDGFDGVCRLDGPDGTAMRDGARDSGGARGFSRAITIEPPSEILIFARVERGVVDRLRLFTPDCAVDTSGARIVRLPSVRPEDSAAWLASLAATGADAGREHHVAQPAMAALALEAGDAASAALVKLARDDPSARVRGQALFWLAQRAGNRAAAAITDAIANDPDTAVKKRAVFALSQLPRDEGVPLLIQVARTNRNPAVRRQAMFWLGQSKDPRAISFFEEILKR